MIDAVTSSGAVTVSLKSNGCTDGQVLGFDGMTWGCQTLPTPVTNVIAGGGLSGGGGGTPTLGLMTCTDGQILKRSGGAWGCAADVDTGLTTVSRDASLVGNGTVGSPLGLMSCADGQILKVSGSAWGCGADVDLDTGLTAVAHDASLAGDGSAANPLAVSYRTAEPTGGVGFSDQAARTDHTHSQKEPLGLSDAHVQGTVTPHAAVYLGASEVLALNLPPGASATWTAQLGFKTVLEPTIVVVSLTTSPYMDGPLFPIPAFSVEVTSVPAGATAATACSLGTPVYASNPPVAGAETLSAVVKASFNLSAACVPRDDATLIIKVTNPGTSPSNAVIFNGFAQIFL
jgi:hypothetical protein